MSIRDEAMAILHYRNYKRFPIVHFGFWRETVEKWRRESHLTAAEAEGVEYGDAGESARNLTQRLGFDFNWHNMAGGNTGLLPGFEWKVLEILPDGYRKVRNSVGAVILDKPGTSSIPPEVDHVLKDRESWEKEFLPRLQYSEKRIDRTIMQSLQDDSLRDVPLGLMCGSLYGTFRDWIGLEGSCYLQADDEVLFAEILDTSAALQFRVAEETLKTGAKFDFGHFWEDICFKSGPLVSPSVFNERLGPWYRKFADLLGRYGIDIISLDCDGLIDQLIPIWIENGINTMFPIEVGTWGASIAPWRKKYGKPVRGVGGMDKRVFSMDYKAIDGEVERLRRLTELGGYIPCPDHRIAPDAKWENVQYYTESMRRAFS